MSELKTYIIHNPYLREDKNFQPYTFLFTEEQAREKNSELKRQKAPGRLILFTKSKPK